MSNKTKLYDQHVAANGKMVDFAGWMMPLNYGSQIDEHMAVRQQAGIFDVSHMTMIDFSGDRTKEFLRYLLANDIQRIQPGRALYSCMLNNDGGVIDDLIVYWLAEDTFRIISNAGTREKDLAWMREQAIVFNVTVTENTDMSILACQGSTAITWGQAILPPALAQALADMKPFRVVVDNDWVLATTGYTGEAGFELMIPNNEVKAFWQSALKQGFKPVGLAARDTLRLEAGLNLYGSDMDEGTLPRESNLAWTISYHDEDRDFIGKESLEAHQTNKQLIGFILQAPGVLRAHQRVYQGSHLVGETTSGTYSPYLKKAIALARVDVEHFDNLTVDIRGKKLPVLPVKPCFVRQGQPKVIELSSTLNKETNT